MSVATRESTVVSSRGQITLPAAIRKQLGIEPGSVVILEEREGGLLLRPAAVVEMEIYSDEQIERWNRDDELDGEELRAVGERLGR